MTMGNALEDKTPRELAKDAKSDSEINEERKKSKKDWGKTAESAGRSLKKTLDKL